jgi:DNA repair photolyase
MQYKQIRVSSLINKITKKDKLFGGQYTIDPYQNCEFGCRYCDSSLEKTIYVKKNAAEILEEELKHLPKGRIILGSVHDPYQKIEEKCEITQNLLNIIKNHGFPCHILTKSNVILRDIDIISRLEKPIVTVSMISLSKSISQIFEKNVPSPQDRLKIVNKLSEKNIKSGVAIIPLLPFIVEKEQESIIQRLKKQDVQYILYKHLELKGNQKKIFIDDLKKFYPSLVVKYEKLYKNSYKPKKKYIFKINSKFNELCNRYYLKNTI